MNLSAARQVIHSQNQPVTDFEILSNIRTVLRQESTEIQRFYDNVPIEMAQAVRLIQNCKGSVIVSGIGKAGWIGQKISASFASTGSRSHFLHAAEAFHGDLGRVHREDVVLILSNSGETEEVTKMILPLQRSGAKLVAITGSAQSSLGTQCDCTIAYGKVVEACQNNLAPSVSTTLMLAIGDSLALAVSCLKGFTALDFAKFHPGGSLGRKLQTVDEVMRPLSSCRKSRANVEVRNAITNQAQHGRRSGALLIVSETNRLKGIFTDSDLVRLLEQRQDDLLDQPIEKMMTADPIRVVSGSLVSEAVEILSDRSISELPVVTKENEVVGLIDITDIIA